MGFLYMCVLVKILYVYYFSYCEVNILKNILRKFILVKLRMLELFLVFGNFIVIIFLVMYVILSWIWLFCK